MKEEILESITNIHTTANNMHLVFNIDKELYSIPITHVQEILVMMPVTKIPRSSDYILGAINLRGKVVPIINMRKCFCIPDKPYDERDCIIVISMQKNNKPMEWGLLVDKVTEVIPIQEEDIDTTPNFNAHEDTQFFKGICKSKEQIIIIVDDKKLVENKDIMQIEEIL